jgi:hypothetical protein
MLHREFASFFIKTMFSSNLRISKKLKKKPMTQVIVSNRFNKLILI